jgi:uncharacterized membrane protein (UPF0136 family)
METDSIFTAILAGIIIGALLAEGMGLDVWLQTFIVQVAVAATLVALVGALTRSRTSRKGVRG